MSRASPAPPARVSRPLGSAWPGASRLRNPPPAPSGAGHYYGARHCRFPELCLAAQRYGEQLFRGEGRRAAKSRDNRDEQASGSVRRGANLARVAWDPESIRSLTVDDAAFYAAVAQILPVFVLAIAVQGELMPNFLKLGLRERAARLDSPAS